MAKRTLQSCWKQYEKLAADYFEGLKPPEECRQKLADLTDKANSDNLGVSLLTLFVRPYLPLELKLEFDNELDGGVPEWQTRYDGENSRIVVCPVAVFKFIREIRELEITDEDYEDFLHCRYVSFLVELAKLPAIYILFLLVLQRVAYLLEVAHLEKRGGVIEIAEGEAYHTLLWAFKELENFAKRTWGLNIRAHYGISWYESEWITGR